MVPLSLHGEVVQILEVPEVAGKEGLTLTDGMGKVDGVIRTRKLNTSWSLCIVPLLSQKMGQKRGSRIVVQIEFHDL